MASLTLTPAVNVNIPFPGENLLQFKIAKSLASKFIHVDTEILNAIQINCAKKNSKLDYPRMEQAVIHIQAYFKGFSSYLLNACA